MSNNRSMKKLNPWIEVMMLKNLRQWLRPMVVVVLAALLFLIPASDVWARSGGRIGGGSFRSAPRMMPRSAPRSAPAPYYPGYGGGFGGGLGFPLVFPFFFGGGGGLITLFLVLGAGSFLIRTLRSAEQDEDGMGGSPRKVQVYEVKVGLLASARNLQKEIDRLALEADTDTPDGLSRLVQDVSLSLVRHQDYWIYGQTDAKTLSLAQAEQAFNQASLQERSKFTAETLSKIGSRQLQKTQGSDLSQQDAEAPSEYIVVTLLVASQGKAGTLPVVDSASSLRQSLTQLASVSAESLVAMEVLWTPQQAGDTLTADEMMAEYPQMRLL